MLTVIKDGMYLILSASLIATLCPALYKNSPLSTEKTPTNSDPQCDIPDQGVSYKDIK